jgi:hypothetical protein
MPPFRLLAVDVDGTISLPGVGVPTEVLAALRDCAAAGVLVVIATGKHPFLIRHLAAAIVPSAPVIGCNGAITIDLSTDRVLTATFIPAVDYLPLIKSLRHDRRIQLAVFTDRDIVCTAPNFASSSLEALGETTGRFLPDLAALAGEPIFKVLVASPDSSNLQFLRRELTPLWESHFSITTSGHSFLEFMAPGVSKGAALARLAAARGITRDQIIAIGDSENDLSMFAVAGFPVAVANAIPAVLQAAHLIVPSAADRGVRYAIDQLILGAGA